MFGFFVVYFDCFNFFVMLFMIIYDLNIDGVMVSIVLIIFFIGYVFLNIFGGVFIQ